MVLSWAVYLDTVLGCRSQHSKVVSAHPHRLVLQQEAWMRNQHANKISCDQC